MTWHLSLLKIDRLCNISFVLSKINTHIFVTKKFCVVTVALISFLWFFLLFFFKCQVTSLAIRFELLPLLDVYVSNRFLLLVQCFFCFNVIHLLLFTVHFLCFEYANFFIEYAAFPFETYILATLNPFMALYLFNFKPIVRYKLKNSYE